MTGGLASGKTCVLGFFRERGAYVVDTDEIVHKLLSPHHPIGKRVISTLGEEVLCGNTLDRRKIAEKVFQNRQLLEEFEQLIHPQVKKEIDALYTRASNSHKYSLFVVEVPLLFECGWEKYFDATIAVVADKELCRERLRAKDPRAVVDYESRSERQLPIEEKAERATFVINNNGTLTSLRLSFEETYQFLTQS